MPFTKQSVSLSKIFSEIRVKQKFYVVIRTQVVKCLNLIEYLPVLIPIFYILESLFFFFQKLRFDIFHKLLTICCFSLYMIWEAKFWTLIRTIIIYQKEHIVVKSAVIGWFVWRLFPIPILFVGIVFTRHLVWHIRKFLLFMEPKGNWLSFKCKFAAVILCVSRS